MIAREHIKQQTIHYTAIQRASRLAEKQIRSAFESIYDNTYSKMTAEEKHSTIHHLLEQKRKEKLGYIGLGKFFNFEEDDMTKEELEQLIAKNHLEHLREDEMRSIHLAHKLAEIGLEPMRQALKEVRKTAYQRMTEKEKLASVKSLISQTETQMQRFQVRYSELEAELKTLEEK